MRSNQIRQLVDSGSIQMSLFDECNLAEIQHPQYRGERLAVCYNPLLAGEKTRRRKDLLEATEKALDKIALETSRRNRKPLGKAEMGLKIGHVLHRHKVERHFSLSIQDKSFTYKRRKASIQRERELDGIYVIRTSEPAKTFSAEDVVRKYESLSEVERAFRCLKGLDILVRPIRHWNDDRVRAHIFICLLAYYVEWNMRKASQPLLFEDEERHEHKEQRDPVARAKASSSPQAKKAAKTNADGTPLHSFDSLLAELGTPCRNRCHLPGAPNQQAFHMLTQATDFQEKALRLLQL